MPNNTTEKKLTKVDYFAMVRDIISRSKVANKADLLGFIDHEVELLKKKSSSSKKTNVQKANTAILTTVKEILEENGKPMTIGDMLEDARLATYTVETKDGQSEIKKMTGQKLSSMVKILKDLGEVVRTVDKKQAYFSLPDSTKEKGGMA